MDRRLKRHPLGFLQVVDPPNDEQLAAYYAEKYFQSDQGNYRNGYTTQELEAIKLRIMLRVKQVDKLRSQDSAGRLLDVGCGEGFVLAAYDSKGWEVEGLDHSLAGVERMNPDQVDNVSQGDLFTLIQQRLRSDIRYDVVWLGNVLEHVIDPVELMRLIKMIIAPSGILVITVPNDGGPYHENLFESQDIPERFWIAIPDHLSYFTAKSLTRTAEATGWKVHNIQGDFPIDFFLSHPGSNYVLDRTRGAAANAARVRLEILIGDAGTDAANALYTALANVGLGRNITAYLSPDKDIMMTNQLNDAPYRSPI